MFIPDMPNVPPQEVPVIIAQAEQAQQSEGERKMGVCFPIDNSPGLTPHGGNVIGPITGAKLYFRLYESNKVDGTATVTVLQNPKHGVLRLVTEADRGTLFSRGSGPLKPDAGLYAYFPDQGYLGNDSATILVDIGGKTVKEVFYFKVVDHPVGNDSDMEICKNGTYWKISSTLNPDGTAPLTPSNTSRPSLTPVQPPPTPPSWLRHCVPAS